MSMNSKDWMALAKKVGAWAWKYRIQIKWFKEWWESRKEDKNESKQI